MPLTEFKSRDRVRLIEVPTTTGTVVFAYDGPDKAQIRWDDDSSDLRDYDDIEPAPTVLSPAVVKMMADWALRIRLVNGAYAAIAESDTPKSVFSQRCRAVEVWGSTPAAALDALARIVEEKA